MSPSPTAAGRARRSVAALACAAALLLVPVTSASAHNQLRSTSPADGGVVDAAPPEVVLTFDQPAIAIGARVVVLAPDGTPVSAGEPRLVDSDVTQDLAGDLPAGEYRVEWRVTSADGHPISGELAFTASGPGRGAAATADGAEGVTADGTGAGDGVLAGLGPVAVVLAGAALAVAVGAVVRRRRPRG